MVKEDNICMCSRMQKIWKYKPRQKSASFLNMVMESVVSLPISCIILEIMIIKDNLSNIAMTLASAVSLIVHCLQYIRHGMGQYR